MYALVNEKVRGHWKCPCGSGAIIRNCHKDAVNDARASSHPVRFGSKADIRAAKGHVRFTCPYQKSNPSVLMVQPTKDRPHFDAPNALNEPSNRRVLA